eukprot:5891136-Amphidinium_carterae.1
MKLQPTLIDKSCTKVEDYYNNVYIDNNGGQVAGLQKPKKPWKPWGKQPWKQPWKNGKGKYDYSKGKDDGKGKGGKDQNGYDKGGKGKYGKPWSKGKEEKAKVTTTTTTANRK